MSLFSPNFTLDEAWRTTLNKVFQQLRRIRFVVEDTFSFGTFDPTVDFQGMTISNYIVQRARFLRIWKFLWLSVDVTVTLASPFTVQMFVILPPGCTVAGDGTDSTDSRQGGSLVMQNNSTLEAGYWLALPLSNRISIQRNAGGNYSAGNARFAFNTFIEVL